MKPLITAMIILIPAAAIADPLGVVLQQDGPWIDLPEGAQVNMTAPDYDDILAMADLDGDPSVTTQDETRMIALLSQVLLGSPVTQ